MSAIVSSMPPTRPAREPFEEEIANMLIAIERNYSREGSGWGSRFEGERLEVVQARAVIRRIREDDAPAPTVHEGGTGTNE